MDRRELLAGSAAALGLATIGVAADAAPFATPRAVDVAGRLRGPALLDAFVRMRGRTDGRLVHGWLRSQRSTVIDGDVTPLCGVVAGAVQRFERIADDVYEATILEVAHYTDPVSGELLDAVTMPGSGRRSAGSRRIASGRSRPASRSRSTNGKSSIRPRAAAARRSSCRNRRSTCCARSTPRWPLGERVALRANEYGRVYPDRSGPQDGLLP